WSPFLLSISLTPFLFSSYPAPFFKAPLPLFCGRGKGEGSAFGHWATKLSCVFWAVSVISDTHAGATPELSRMTVDCLTLPAPRTETSTLTLPIGLPATKRERGSEEERKRAFRSLPSTNRGSLPARDGPGGRGLWGQTRVALHRRRPDSSHFALPRKCL